MRVKKSFSISIVLIFLATLIVVPMRISSSPSPVTVSVEMPDGYIPEKPVGTKFWVDFKINADDLEYNGPSGIIWWRLLVQVNPAVLKPFLVKTSVPGYFLYDFADLNFYSYPQSVYDVNETSGLVEVAEMFFAPLPPGGAATDDANLPAPYKLVSIAYEVVGAGSTLIDTFNSGYTVLSAPEPQNLIRMEEVDGWYGKPLNVLTVESTPIDGIDFTVDTTAYTTNATVELVEGFYTVAMPSAWMVGTDQYDFLEWEDGSTDPVRTVSLTADTTITATYVPVYNLTVESTPIDGIDFTVDTTAYTTNATVELVEGSYTVVMPSTWMTVGGDVYNFAQWEDASTSASRVVSLTADTTITATYEPELIDPTASFTFLPTEPIVDETVTFNASASNDPDGTVVSYAWDFGDGASGSGAIVEHTYAAAGNYDVTLIVTDNDELAHTITKSITVREAPPPSIPWQLYVAAAGAAAIIIAAVTIYFLRIRKPKPT